jgi:two-component system CheB/CheR fusion protein
MSMPRASIADDRTYRREPAQQIPRRLASVPSTIVSLWTIEPSPSLHSMMRNGTLATVDQQGKATDLVPTVRLLLDIIDTVREPLLVLDSDFRVTQANRSFFQTFRVARADTIGESLFALGDGQWNIPSLRDLLHHKLAAQPELYDIDVDHVFPGIGRRIMLLNARLVSNGQHTPRVILLAIEDVTERRVTERRLAAQREELRRSNAALKEFAFVASHDLQEPLRKILSFGERLETSAGPLLEGNARQYLDRMLNAATRMRTLITDVLAFSQIAASVEPFTTTDLGEVARDVVIDLETSVANSGGRIDVGYLPVIDADAHQMRRLFQNLLGNALKFRRKDTPPVVRLDASVSGDGFCTMTVTDNGIGLKEEHAIKIFRMFERLNGREAYEGSGIGLAICRKIVERHRGTIVATSTVGEGTTLTITLPVTQVEPEYLI